MLAGVDLAEGNDAHCGDGSVDDAWVDGSVLVG